MVREWVDSLWETPGDACPVWNQKSDEELEGTPFVGYRRDCNGGVVLRFISRGTL